jgi:hypothetical protein
MRRTANSFTDGMPRPIRPSDKLPLTKPYSTFSAPCRISTGAADSEKVGSVLIFLAAQSQGWHRVPWRMLRNVYMDYGSGERERGKGEMTPPTSLEAANIPDVPGKPETIAKLVAGLEDLLARNLIIRSEDRGETFFAPTDDLLACVV